MTPRSKGWLRAARITVRVLEALVVALSSFLGAQAAAPM